ncbi:GntR family transcriptional regulator [Rhodococcoides yunnanense]|uniref:GntR family transcriptional regulator n=1 Tax=Rhodococcoides yunnanense TaxID=278209 RepID=A0ABU4B7S8_9NOCA|nr:GntR family transcriptional regulator [Rhodococcus yunnanensis]MDV6260249.1 GntR family transcriptional regulator [Rhodococcus yunnanensis]
MTQNADSRLPLHARLKDDLNGRIVANEWGPDVALPSEAELAAAYDVSVGTMRRVLGDFVADGLLDRRQGRGTFVRRPTFDNAFFRFFRARGDGNRVPDARILARVRHAASDDIARALNHDGDVVHIHRIREHDATPFLVEDIWLPLPRFDSIADMDIADIGPLLYPAYEQHSGVIVGSATEDLSFGATDPEIAAELGCQPDEALVRIERTARTHAGDVVEHRVSHGVAAAFRYRLELR